MEISRRHYQETERAELAELLERRESTPAELEEQERAAETQNILDGMTRNQRRLFIKRMKKASK